jgi:MFS family permease
MENKRVPLLNVNLRWFMLAMILANIAGQMAYSMMSLYLISLGASVGQVGMVYTLASLIPIVLQIFGGWLSDTIGRLRAIAIGSAISVFGYLFFIISPSWQWVLLGLSVEYISSSFVGPSFSAYIAEQSEEANRGKVYGLSSGIYMVVTVIGPALAGFLAYRYGFHSMLTAAFAFYLTATIVRVWMARAERFSASHKSGIPTLQGLTTQLRSILVLLTAGGVLTWIWITDAIGDTSFSLTGDLFPIYLSQIGQLTVEQIGLLGSAWGIASIGGSFLGGWLTDKRSERTMLAGGFLLIALSLGVMMLARSQAMFLISRLLNGFGEGILMPAYNSLISKVVPEEKRGLAFGFLGTSLGILSLPMPWIGAQLWEGFTPQMPFWITAAFCLATVPIAWYKFVLPKSAVKAEGG